MVYGRLGLPVGARAAPEKPRLAECVVAGSYATIRARCGLSLAGYGSLPYQ